MIGAAIGTGNGSGYKSSPGNDAFLESGWKS